MERLEGQSNELNPSAQASRFAPSRHNEMARAQWLTSAIAMAPPIPPLAPVTRASSSRKTLTSQPDLLWRALCARQLGHVHSHAIAIEAQLTSRLDFAQQLVSEMEHTVSDCAAVIVERNCLFGEVAQIVARR